MKLLVISAMPHHRRSDGTIVGWGPTVRELDHLASRFESVRHVAPLHDGPALTSDLPYSTTNLELVPVTPSGAEGFIGKLDVLRRSPEYVRVILRELPHADIVHVRAPANIALIAMLIASVRALPRGRWFKYAGNWRPDGRESPSYRLQRWWLGRTWHRGVVTVNGAWPDQPEWIRTFYNPSLDQHEVAAGRAAAAAKVLAAPVRLLYIGRVETPKGTGRAIEIVARLRRNAVDCTLDIVGDGDERRGFEQAVADAGLGSRIRFLGWRSHDELGELYRDAHILLLPTAASEGWPKVLSEGMAYGVVPVAGAVSAIPQYLEEFGVGAAIPADDLDRFVTTITRFLEHPTLWKEQSARAATVAQYFTFQHYLDSVDALLGWIERTSPSQA